MPERIFCVFCGSPPNSKNKEHVIPKWLMSLTGNPNRKIKFRSPFFDQDRPFSTFEFPACVDCNSKYSALEKSTSKIFKKLSSNEGLNTFEINDLLDWFDKVRTGLWLGYKYLYKSTDRHTRHFHISDRIGKKDRSLQIFKLSEINESFFIQGIANIAFDLSPSCFVMIVNDLAFISGSYEGLYARELGYPYMVNKTLHMKNEVLTTEGIFRKTKIILSKSPAFVPNSNFSVFQIIYAVQDSTKNFRTIEPRINEYGRSPIYTIKNNKFIVLDENTSLALSSKEIISDLLIRKNLAIQWGKTFLRIFSKNKYNYTMLPKEIAAKLKKNEIETKKYLKMYLFRIRIEPPFENSISFLFKILPSGIEKHLIKMRYFFLNKFGF